MKMHVRVAILVALIAIVGCAHNNGGGRMDAQDFVRDASEEDIPIHKTWSADRFVNDPETGQYKEAFEFPRLWVIRNEEDLPKGFPLNGVSLKEYMLVLGFPESLSGDATFTFERVTRTRGEVRVIAREYSGYLTNAVAHPITVIAIPRYDLPVRIIIKNEWKERDAVVIVSPDGSQVCNGLRLDIEVDKVKYKIGEPIEVHFGLVNVSQEPVRVVTNVPGGTNLLYFTSVMLFDSVGNAFEGNDRHHRSLRWSGDRPGGGYTTETLPPGLGIGGSTLITEYGRPVPAGKYRIVGSYGAHGPSSPRSSPLTITVGE